MYLIIFLIYDLMINKPCYQIHVHRHLFLMHLLDKRNDFFINQISVQLLLQMYEKNRNSFAENILIFNKV